MAGKKSDMGPTGVNVTHAVRRYRKQRGLSYAELSRQLGEAGREIPPLGLRRIESGDRRVDVDDLVALAAALGVSPISLMMPPVVDRSTPVATTGVEGEVSAESLWLWLSASYPLPHAEPLLTFAAAAWPKWEATEMADKLGPIHRRLVDTGKGDSHGSD